MLGKRLGKAMGVVAKEVKAMSQEDILAFEKVGEITIATHCLRLSEIKVYAFTLKAAILFILDKMYCLILN